MVTRSHAKLLVRTYTLPLCVLPVQLDRQVWECCAHLAPKTTNPFKKRPTKSPTLSQVRWRWQCEFLLHPKVVGRCPWGEGDRPKKDDGRNEQGQQHRR